MRLFNRDRKNIETAPGRAEENAPEPVRLTRREFDDQCRRWRLLLVEDNDFLRESLSVSLHAYFGEIVAAENGQIGLQKYLADPFEYDAVLLDMQMPVMDGWEMGRLLRGSGAKNAARIPILAMSGESTAGVSAPYFSAILKKPFWSSDVLEALYGLFA